MRVEVGKFYITRAAQKVRIYAVDGIGERCVHGAICRHEDWDSDKWFLGGMWDYTPSGNDIVAEWKEPYPRRVIWAGGAGNLFIKNENWKPESSFETYWTRIAWLDEPEKI